MEKFNRDLLVLFREESNPQAIEHEVELLHELLFEVERIDCLVVAHEVFDVNRYKIHTSAKAVKKIIRERHLKPFIFISNMN